MSDPVLEEDDDLISQDDIDKLLDISSGDDDDADELSQGDIDNLLNGPEPASEDSDDGDAGELSQEDIDRMMGGGAPDDDSSEDDGELSQDDIDGLLNGPEPDGDDPDAGDADAGELSQDDIDRMMGGSAPDDDSPGDDGDDDELISLEDIQGVMSDDTQEDDAFDSESESESGPEPDLVSDGDPESGALEAESSQDDAVAQNMEDPPVDDGAAGEVPGPEEDPLDVPIEAEQAVDVENCMISQEAMDALIEAGLPAPDVPEGDAGAPEPDAAEGGDDNLPGGVDQAFGADDVGTADAEGDVSRESEGEAIQEGENDATPEDEDDVTQDDIDALLQQSDEEDGFLDEDEDILISQDDINTLLMAADQEDEDVLGDISGEDDVSDLETQPDDGFESPASDSDQVVLEGIEGDGISGGKASAPAGPSEKGEKIKALLRSKVMLAAASVLLFMGISVPLSYFLFFSSDPVPLPERQTASLTEIDLTRDGQADFSADMPVLPPSRRPGTILLTDFIILASDQSQAMTYVYADVSIDYSDQRAYDEINSNLAFYRDLIYGAIQTRLVSEKNNEVTEADLLWGVEASLKKVLPPQYIDKISFKSFKAT